eukprot:3921718-Rhodomonas_salina.1
MPPNAAPTIRYLSTGNRVAPYAVSDMRYLSTGLGVGHTLCQYSMAVPEPTRQPKRVLST